MTSETGRHGKVAAGRFWAKERALLFAALVLPMLAAGCGGSVGDGGGAPQDEATALGSEPNKALYGTPHKIKVAQVAKNQTDITFGLISDTHIDATQCDRIFLSNSGYGYNDSPYMQNNRTTVDDLNIDCKSPECLGVVHMGDMIEQKPSQDEYATQQVIGFRQLYENDYPGRNGGAIRGCSDTNYEAYNKGHKIKVPVFPTLGNHDGPSGWHKPADYLDERITGAPGIVSQYGKASYIWRWGQYYFIQLGLWAGSKESVVEYPTDAEIDNGKIKWLKDWLRSHVGDSNMGVLIFQHYDFGAGKRWWNKDMENMELNVLCRRDNDAGPCEPYNVLGIFAGHEHLKDFRTIAAGADALGKEVSFDEYVMPDVGKDNNKQRGHSIVRLQDKLMTINTKNRHNNTWSNYQKPIGTGPGDPNSFRYTIGWDLQSGGNTWSPLVTFLDKPFGGGVPAGGGTAIADIDGNGKPDLVLMGVDSSGGRGGNRFYYKLGLNLNSDGTTSDWSHAKWAPPILGASSSGGGAAIADIDGNGKPDLLFMVVDNPGGQNNFRYVIGWNLDASGDPVAWSPLKYAPASLPIGVDSAGGGAAIADIDGNGRPDLVFMVVDNPDGMNNFRYTVGWNLDANGDPASWSEIKYVPASVAVGHESAGGGADIADLDGNGRPDLVLSVVDNPDGINNFRYVVGWNLDAKGNPALWSPLRYAPTSLDIGAENAGGGAAMADIRGNGVLDLLLTAIDNP
jgi:hypothetical protein